MVLRKDQLEASLHEEKKLIKDGRLKEDNPLDFSESFAKLCEACRRGDLKVCQEMITEGANINARDSFDYTPLILVSRSLSSSACALLRALDASPPSKFLGQLHILLCAEQARLIARMTRLVFVGITKSYSYSLNLARCANETHFKARGIL